MQTNHGTNATKGSWAHIIGVLAGKQRCFSLSNKVILPLHGFKHCFKVRLVVLATFLPSGGRVSETRTYGLGGEKVSGIKFFYK